MIAGRMHLADRLARTVAVPILVLVGLLATAQPALAHHASIDATATCSNGTYVVDWQARSWVATDGTTDFGGRASAWRGLNQHPGITISYRIGRNGPFTPLDGVHTLTAADTTPVVINGQPHDFPSASSSFELPGDTAGRLYVRVSVGPWGPDPETGHYVTLGPPTKTSDSIRLAGDCEGSEPAPALPSASAAAVCVSGSPVIRVTLANGNVVGGESFTFSVSSPASGSKPSFQQSDIAVGAASSTTVDVPVDENGSRIVTTAGSGFSESFTVAGNCSADPRPSASAAALCVDTAAVIRATLSNDNGAGGESVTFSVTAPAAGSQSAFSQSLTVNGGATTTVDVPVDENGTRTVSIQAPGMTDVVVTATGNCVDGADPSASAAAVCVSGSPVIRVTLSNENAAGGESFTFGVSSLASGSKPSFEQSGIVVAAASSTTVDVPVDEGGTRIVTASGAGFSESFTLSGNCVADPAPSASLAVVCVDDAGVIRATLSNDNGAGGQSVTFTVSSPAGSGLPTFSQDVTVAGGATTTIDVPGQENAVRTVSVTTPGMTPVSESLTVNCVASPAPRVVSVDQECFLEQIRVTVQNDNGAGGESVEFTITSVAGGGFGAFSASFTVEGGQTRGMDVPAVEDGTRVVVVSAPGMTTQTFTVTLDCV